MCARSQTSGDCSGEIACVSCSSESGASSASVRDRACPSAEASSVGDTELSQAAEDERGDHRALSDRGGDAFRRAVANVTRREEPDPARLERKRITLERPTLWSLPVDQEILSREDVAGLIREHVLARAPVRVGRSTDAEEDAVHRTRLRFPGGV